MSNKIYPIGIQNFESLRQDGYFYIDKTALMYQMVKTGRYYFLSRPRRFGKSGSVVILGGLSLVNSLHAYTFASLKRKKLISTTPLNDALNALILALNASAAAFVLLFTKKFRILS